LTSSINYDTIKLPKCGVWIWVDYNYYNLPWERTADLFGGVGRKEHTAGALVFSLFYFMMV
jgi:hypothetical protein